MALAVCWLFDRRSERISAHSGTAWRNVGVPSLKTLTHGRHVPLCPLAVLREWDHDELKSSLGVSVGLVVWGVLLVVSGG